MTFLLIIQILNVLGYCFMIAMNAVSMFNPFNGQDNSAISNKYPTRFTPAGYAFSIWGVIFILLGFFTIYQAFPSHRLWDGFLGRIHLAFFFNTILNGVWLVAFAYEVFWASIIIMLGILGTLIFIYIRVDIGQNLGPVNPYVCCYRPLKDTLEEATRSVRDSLVRFWFVELPFSVYLGWISVATIANFSIFFTSLGWTNWAEGWSVIVQLVAFLLALAMLCFFLDIGYACVIIWATVAIAINQKDSELVMIAAYAFAGTLGFFTLGALVYRIVKFSGFVRHTSLQYTAN